MFSKLAFSHLCVGAPKTGLHTRNAWNWTVLQIHGPYSWQGVCLQGWGGPGSGPKMLGSLGRDQRCSRPERPWLLLSRPRSQQELPARLRGSSGWPAAVLKVQAWHWGHRPASCCPSVRAPGVSLYLLPPWPLKPPLLPAPPSFQTPSHGGLRTVFVSRSCTRLIKCIPACLIFLIVFI